MPDLCERFGDTRVIADVFHPLHRFNLSQGGVEQLQVIQRHDIAILQRIVFPQIAFIGFFQQLIPHILQCLLLGAELHRADIGDPLQLFAHRL